MNKKEQIKLISPPIITGKNCIYQHSSEDPIHCKNMTCISCALQHAEHDKDLMQVMPGPAML